MDWRERLQRRIDTLGITRAEVARRAGVNATAIRDIIDREQTPSVENLAKIARSVGYTLSDLYEGTDRVHISLRVNGVSTGNSMWAEIPAKHSKIVPLQILDDEFVSVEIGNDDLLPAYRRGDIVAGPKFSGVAVDNILGADCIVETADGSKVICILLSAERAGSYTLRSFDLRQKDKPAVKLSWAAPIRLILRGER